MSKEEQINRILNSGTIIVVAAAIFFVTAILLYPKFPRGYWIAAVLFVLFGSEHLFNFISRIDSGLFSLVSSVAMKRVIALLVSFAFVVSTWLVVDGI